MRKANRGIRWTDFGVIFSMEERVGRLFCEEEVREGRGRRLRRGERREKRRRV